MLGALGPGAGPVEQQRRRFYDGGVPPGPPDPDADPRIVLDRLTERGAEVFALERRIGYRDRHLGELLVPADVATFRTDLTSVPTLFTWLVPKTGTHLPAALLHDGLVHDPGTAPTYVATEGHVVDRVEADRVFRDAMADTGTGVVRRWLVWSAVTTATMVSGSVRWSPARLWRYRLAVVLTVLAVAYLGVCATADLVDADLPGLVPLPWMGERPWYAELLGGLSGALVVPVVLGLTWGRFRVAGTVVGVGLAVLLHVTVVLLLLTAAYRVAEWLAGRHPGPARALVALAGVGALVVVLVMSLG